ncbi:hypothetical protein DPMN_106083 [Dreissena polymorpha]|uniref:Uncharacterized protein n=1 Tax=Dreissena polymorpha TaxID=45954 RepID=A0A9D4K4B9_DREPO|nr:hypothetical protein DPMN_106083 [Dreissena polymorpha]
MHTHDIVLMSDKNAGTTRKPKMWSAQKTKTVLGPQLCHILRALHALTGCDTDLRIFGIGKGIAFKKAKSSHFAEFLEGTRQKQVTEVSERIIVALYSGSSFSDLNSLRLHLFTDKTINDINSVQIHTLPPTSAAAKFHSLQAR